MLFGIFPPVSSHVKSHVNEHENKNLKKLKLWNAEWSGDIPRNLSTKYGLTVSENTDFVDGR